MDAESEYIQYWNSLYFCVVTLSTVGYGDLLPGTIIEKQLVVTMILFNTIYFGWVLNSISSILGQYDYKERENM